MARSFNGSTDQVKTTTFWTSATSNITIAIWAYQLNATGTQSPFYSGNTDLNGYGVLSSNSGDGKLYGFNANVVNSIYGGTNSTPLNTWFHVAITSAGTLWTLYLNGQKDPVTSTTTPIAPSAASTVGGVQNNAGFAAGLSGRCADLGVWTTTLTAAEILALANGARPRDIRSASLKTWWPLDGLQSPEPDLSGNANNGTLTGTALASGPPVMQFTPRWPQLTLSSPATILMPQILM